MAAGSHSFSIEQGTTFTKVITWKDSQVPPVPYNLTGYTARAQVRATTAAPDPPLFSFTTENGRIVLGGSAGTITLTITASDTAAISWVTGVYDLELISGTGVVTRLLKGTITIDPEVTRGP